MFTKVLVANRGEIACRILRTLRAMAISSVAVYTDADAGSLHVRMADEAIRIGEGPVALSYLDQTLILDVATSLGAEALHPGYGFLSENAAFASACGAAGVTWIGPDPDHIRRFGDKHEARALAADLGVGLLAGTGLLDSVDSAVDAASRIGYPVMLKATAGGGGIGMQRCDGPAALAQAFETVTRLARNHFGEGGVFIERFVERARHVEVQLFGANGEVVALGERDCSAQRRHQKVIEEAPPVGLPAELLASLRADALRLGRAVGYRSAGTVEFVVDVERLDAAFLEVNTRLQVEHAVTELVAGIDLVEWMVLEAAGSLDDLGERATRLVARGAAIEARVYAEDPAHGNRPQSGELVGLAFPAGVRVDTWVEAGTEISSWYDPLVAKVVVHGEDRGAAVEALDRALTDVRVDGVATNVGLLAAAVADGRFVDGGYTTSFLDAVAYRPATIEVLAGGMQTTVQDHPGRLGYWAIGVPPSGPMDDLAFRLGNQLLGNHPSAAGLEVVLAGPTLRFDTPALVAITGAAMDATVDGVAVPGWTALAVAAGSTLSIGSPTGAGCRAYVCVRGGLDIPMYLGSRSTFLLGGFGGHRGRALAPGDVLVFGAVTPVAEAGDVVPAALVPVYGREWHVGVVDGPHGAPDFLTPAGIDAFFAAAWHVHHHSDRTGVRLVGPTPEWARPDGGEAGLHPSNIHDTTYAVGAVDFTGDMPVVLGPDGPSLGGFVCPVTTVSADRWKLGQLTAGDLVRFVRLDPVAALALMEAQEEELATLNAAGASVVASVGAPPREVEAAWDVEAAEVRPAGGAAARGFAGANPVLRSRVLDPDTTDRPSVTYRRSGDRCVLVEYGDNVLDLALRFRIHALMEALGAARIRGIEELSPGIRSLQVRHDPRVLPTARLIDALEAVEVKLPAATDLVVPSRIVHLPLSWDDPATRLAIDRYMKVVRDDAPWCPWNIEFIRRINGLDTVDEVREIVFAASYVVLGLGDVYLGAPVATPLDPRHRLVTTKYNPARTWTPENAVGIGGAYLCVYGMEGPGGYQFVGRTVQMWNRYRRTPDFPGSRRWLLRFFDQLRFYPVGADELLDLRCDFALGRHQLEITETELSLAEYRRFLADESGTIDAFKLRQRAAFDAERQRWEASGELARIATVPEDDGDADAVEATVPDGAIGVSTPVQGVVAQVVAVGDEVEQGAAVVVVEAMKMETAVPCPMSGTVTEVRCRPGQIVTAGQTLIVLAGP
ncbi:MAG: urea carboxylase [Acidimicrobiia bacterium]